MEKLNMVKLQDDFGCKTEVQKLMLSELVYAVIIEPSNKTGYSADKDNAVSKALFGDKADTDEVAIVRLAGYWANDLACIFAMSLGMDSRDVNEKVFGRIFKEIDGKEIADGVVFTR